jgi:biopolymer transport protein ExbD
LICDSGFPWLDFSNSQIKNQKSTIVNSGYSGTFSAIQVSILLAGDRRVEMAMTLGGRSTSAEMNVTPLIDVLLVLIIIFMILPHHSVGERTQIPQKSTDPTTVLQPETPIVIQLQQTAEGQPPDLAINHQKISLDNLEARLKEIFSLRMDKVAFVKGDPEIEFQYVANVVDVTQHAGALHIGLLGTD